MAEVNHQTPFNYIAKTLGLWRSAEDLSSLRYLAVGLNGANEEPMWQTPDIGGTIPAIGIVQNTPIAGGTAKVQVFGISPAVLSDTSTPIAINTNLAALPDGTLFPSSTGLFMSVSDGLPGQLINVIIGGSGAAAPSGDHSTLANLDSDDHTQYHTDSRALSWLSTRSTSDLPEGSGLYFTDSRVASSPQVNNNTNKLSTIQSGAQINPTDLQIKVSYESNLDTNAFTDSEKTNLSQQSGTNTGDENTLSIQTKRPLKTVDGQSLEGSGDIVFPSTGVQSVTGDGVSGTVTDPILSFPTSDEIDDSGVNKFVTAAEKAIIANQSGTNTGDETALTIKTKYESNPDTEAFTTAEKTKLASLESSKFVGEFISLVALQTAFPTAPTGSYAYVDTGVGQPVEKYIWDSNDSQWELQQGQSTAETPASIKTKYESNPDTNPFTDAEQTILAQQSGTNTGDETLASLQIKRPLRTVDGETLDSTGGDISIGVSSITGDGVGGTLFNPVLSFPNADQVDDSTTNKKFATTAQLGQISTNSTDIVNLQNNKVNSVTGPRVDNTNPLDPFIKLSDYRSSQATISRPGQTFVALANQQNNVFETYFEDTFTPSQTDNFTVSIGFRWSSNVTNTNALFRITLDDGLNPPLVDNIRIEPKDSGGAGEVVNIIESGSIVGTVNSGTDQRIQEYFSIDTVLNSAQNYTLTLEFAKEVGNSELTIYTCTTRWKQETQSP